MRYKKPIPENIGHYVKYDETSPSGLTWIAQIRPNNNNKTGRACGVHSIYGYWSTKFNGTSYRNHRIIWTLINGTIPEDYEIDHIDGNRSNNNISNLRLATFGQNQSNAKRPKHNKTGHKNISIKHCKNKLYGDYKYYIVGIDNVVKPFPYTEDGLAAAIKYRDDRLIVVHGEFANNGVTAEGDNNE